MKVEDSLVALGLRYGQTFTWEGEEGGHRLLLTHPDGCRNSLLCKDSYDEEKLLLLVEFIGMTPCVHVAYRRAVKSGDARHAAVMKKFVEESDKCLN